MLDASVRRVIGPGLEVAGRRLARAGIGADGLTLGGFAVGLAAVAAIVAGWYLTAAILVAINRIADGLDGAVARASGRTDRGGYLDITLDFAFYGLIPLAFAIADPARNALPAAAVLASFYLNGAAFLAFAALAEKRGLSTSAQGEKSIFYLAGLAEGTETIAVFLAWCLLPTWFPVLATAMAVLTGVSAVARIVIGARVLSSEGRSPPGS